MRENFGKHMSIAKKSISQIKLVSRVSHAPPPPQNALTAPGLGCTLLLPLLLLLLPPQEVAHPGQWSSHISKCTEL